MTQPTLFDTDAPTGAYGQPAEPTPSRGWATAEELKRTGRHRDMVHARLLEGEATNGELNAISPRFGARIKELRDEGVNIVIVRRNRTTGEVVYAIAS